MALSEVKQIMIVVVIFTSSFIANDGKSQTYTYLNFPDSGIVWQGYTACGTFGNITYAQWKVRVIKDTMISSYSYHQLSVNTYVREDSSKRVYVLFSYDTIETLLYNFSASPGDTIYYPHGIKYVVGYIDTPVYFGIARRTIHLNDRYGSPEHAWIEGIGSDIGPLDEIAILNNSFCHNIWLCRAITDNSTLYETSDSTYCNYNSVEDFFSNEKIKLYPNPWGNRLEIKLPQTPLSETYFILYNQMGEEVLRHRLLTPSTVIYRNNLTSNLYFWQIQSTTDLLQSGTLLVGEGE